MKERAYIVVSPAVHRRLKVEAVRMNISITSLVEELLRRGLRLGFDIIESATEADRFKVIDKELEDQDPFKS